MKIAKVIIKNTAIKPIITYKHPWVFHTAIKDILNYRQPGQIAKLYTPKGRYIATGYINTNSAIPIRILTYAQNEEITHSFIRTRISKAFSLRTRILGLRNTDAFRIVNSESDKLPGLIIDKYSDVAVVQVLTYGMENMKYWIIQTLKDLGFQNIYERSDTEHRIKEGLPLIKEKLLGEIKNPILITENEIRFWVDFVNGQKTGFYLDQRNNRLEILKYAKDKTVCDCFSYTGGFGIYATKAGAKKVIAVDTSEQALELLEENYKLNGLEPPYTIKANVFKFLKDFSHQFDIVVIDPPKFAKHRKAVKSAIEGYKQLNKYALRKIKNGGILFSFSCSGLISLPTFITEVILKAASSTNKELFIFKELQASEDHGRTVYFPEGKYLKGIIGIIY